MKRGIQTRLAEARKRRGIGAAALAKTIGVTRQTIYAIEAGTYIPNTEIALKMARELETTVEELFALADERKNSAPTIAAEYLGRDAPFQGQAVRVGRVGPKWVSVPVDARPYHLPQADALVVAPEARARKARLRIFSEGPASHSPVIMAGCDPAATILSGMVERLSGVEIVHAPASSQLALDWLREGKVHVAGSHLEDPDSSEFNLPFIRRQFSDRDMAVITFARWEEGLVVAAGNPKRIARVEDLASPHIGIVNREPGSGSRALLDRLIARAGISPRKLRGYDNVALGHLAAAYTVLTGAADCCIATASAAQTFGLGFVPLHSAQYDFVLHRDTLGLASIQALFDALHRSALRRKLEALAGYDTSHTGVARV